MERRFEQAQEQMKYLVNNLIGSTIETVNVDDEEYYPYISSIVVKTKCGESMRISVDVWHDPKCLEVE